MTDPTPDTPPTLVERLRNTASHLTDACASGQFAPLPETVFCLSKLYREAADALSVAAETEAAISRAHGNTGALAAIKSAEETRQWLRGIVGPGGPVERIALSHLARLAVRRVTGLEESNKTLHETVVLQEQALATLQASADPPNRAPLLALLEGLVAERTQEPGAAMVVQILRDTIAAIRTDARVIESARANLKAWHSWARKIGRAEGDEYASAMPATLQARIAGQVEAGQLALLVEPVRRRVELSLALCADMGLGGPEAAELAPKAALWTDGEVAEVEAFRTKDWSDTGLNPFDHLPAALERTVYPNGGRRAYLKRAGEPLPPEAPAPVEHQLGLPGLPKPETAMRLRLALIDKPDGPLASLVAGFAQALLEKLDDMQEDALWTSPEQGDRLRRRVRQHVENGDPRDVAVYCAWAWHHGWSLALWNRHVHLDQVDRDILAAKPEDRADVLLEGLQRHMEAVGSTTAERHHADLRHAMGHTASKPSDLDALHAILTGLLNAEPPLDLEVFPVDPATGEHSLEGEGGLEMAARLLTLARQRGAFDRRPAPTDPPSPPGYTPWISMGNSGWALDDVRVADDVIGAWAHYAGRWTSWARELAGCSDGTDEELRGYIARLVGRLHAQRAKNLAELDSPQ